MSNPNDHLVDYCKRLSQDIYFAYSALATVEALAPQPPATGRPDAPAFFALRGMLTQALVVSISRAFDKDNRTTSFCGLAKWIMAEHKARAGGPYDFDASVLTTLASAEKWFKTDRDIVEIRDVRNNFYAHRNDDIARGAKRIKGTTLDACRQVLDSASTHINAILGTLGSVEIFHAAAYETSKGNALHIVDQYWRGVEASREDRRKRHS